MARGGLRILVAGLSNADAIAHAIVGAARYYGDDPIEAASAPSRKGCGLGGRAIPAAICALDEHAGDLPKLAEVLGRRPAAVRATRNKKHPGFAQAVEAARKSVAAAKTKAMMDWAAGLVAVRDAARPTEAAPAAVERLPVHRPVAGAITAPIRPVYTPMAAQPSRPGGLRAQLLAALKAGDRNSQSLASQIGAKETLVDQTLRILRHEGQVTSDPVDGRGRNARWMLAEGADA
jgi:hypothetical protein